MFTREQQFDTEELDHVLANRYTIEWNFKKGNYIRQLEGSSYEDLHDPAKENEVIRCPWWHKHQGDFPSYKPRRGYSKAQRTAKSTNELWWYGAPKHSLLGPVANAGWSKDLLSYQVEVPIPKFIRAAFSGNGEPWCFNGFEGTDKRHEVDDSCKEVLTGRQTDTVF